jgi:hypothetical protein
LLIELYCLEWIVPRTADNKSPGRQIAAAKYKLKLIVFSNSAELDGSIWAVPKLRAITSVTNTMLDNWPSIRVVETAAAAEPRCFLDTELIMAFTLGEENKLNPSPVTTSASTILEV